jgi:hypothetical protein
MELSTAIWASTRADDPVIGSQRDLLEPGEDAEPDPLVATVADRGGRAGRVVAEQVVSAIAW